MVGFALAALMAKSTRPEDCIEVFRGTTLIRIR